MRTKSGARPIVSATAVRSSSASKYGEPQCRSESWAITNASRSITVQSTVDPVATKVAVIGAGSWGTAVAAIACHNAPTMLWARRKELADEISTTHVNSAYLADYPLPEALSASASLEETLTGADVVVMGVPSHGFRDVLDEGRAFIGAACPCSA